MANTATIVYDEDGSTLVRMHGQVAVRIVAIEHGRWVVVSPTEGIVDSAPRYIQALDKAEKFVQFRAIQGRL